jgi:hypothetical protein
MTVDTIRERNEFTKAVHETMSNPHEMEVEHCREIDFLLAEIACLNKALDVIENTLKDDVALSEGCAYISAKDIVAEKKKALKIAGRMK